jgi:hypothetical protein
MRIVFIDTTLTTPPSGGATTFLVELCAALAAHGDRVTVITQAGPEQSVARALSAAGAEVRQDLWRAVHLPEERAVRLARWVCSEQVEVYAISISADAGWLALPLLEPTLATVAIVHSDGPTFYNPLAHYHTLIDCAVGVSREAHRKIIDLCHIPPARAHYIAYGVSSFTRVQMETRCALPVDPQAPLRFAYVGRLVQAQTYQHWECIVVDDGSTDNTDGVVRTFTESDSRIKYIRQENRGLAAARNTGIGTSAGNYFQFLDADDLIETEKLARQVEFLEEHPEVDIVFADVRYFKTGDPDQQLFFSGK